MTYREYIESKAITDSVSGFDPGVINPKLFDFQRDIVRWALRRGRAAIFADCGLGKTPMQLEWAYRVPGRVLIAAPLAVAGQTVREGSKFGIDCRYLRQDDGCTEIVVTNYEMLDRFDPESFKGIVLDESSILKSFTGKIRTQLIRDWGVLPYRLAATATPAPNDYMELGNHAEFLGAMSRTEMLSMFFVHDGGETQKWRLKGHAESRFWEWMSSWAVMIRKPSDLGYADGAFLLPDCRIENLRVEVAAKSSGHLFAMPAMTLQERIAARRESVGERCAAAAAMANDSSDHWLLWCGLNAESQALARAVPDAVEVSGSDSIDVKEDRMIGFAEGRYRVLITKPSIAGFGMNWQHCARMAFVGLSDSYEQFYQALRRCWRFGQKSRVEAWIVTSEQEGEVVRNVRRKEADSERMSESMLDNMKDINALNVHGTQRMITEYNPDVGIATPDFLRS